jgi:sugar lactone lactonase YvrE
MPAAEQLTEPVADHGEGPVWCSEWGGLRWVDMLAGDVLHLDHHTGEVSRWHVGKVAAALRPRKSGGAVIATERDFVLADSMGAQTRPAAQAIVASGIRFNDGGCDPHGNFYCGTMAYDETSGAGALYRLDPIDHSVRKVLGDVTISNGLAWTGDGSNAYYVDTPTGRVDVFDVDTNGELVDRRPFVSIDPSDGSPDGLTVDSAGGVWVALWNGHAVHYYDSSGTLAEVVSVGPRHVTACTLGGPDLADLYVTTSATGGGVRSEGAGAIYLHRAEVPGLPVLPFTG